jgi:competence protein ComEA
MEFFSYSRSELRGITVLIFLILVFVSVRIYIATHDHTILITYISQGHEAHNSDKPNIQYKKITNNKAGANLQLEQFDPNILDYDKLLKLGFSVYVAKNIIKYRNNGGRFYHSEDLLKIYGIDTQLYNRLQPYITIEVTKQKVKLTKSADNYKPLQVNINRADSLELKKIPGIGTVLSKRIVKYRQLLGGFVSYSQLKEVYGISDSLLFSIEKYIVLDTMALVSININTCTISELEKHPYINHYQAKAIESYRKLAGPFKYKKQLLENYLLNYENYLKIAPYLALN